VERNEDRREKAEVWKGWKKENKKFVDSDQLAWEAHV
jgi:hypothetical protein